MRCVTGRVDKPVEWASSGKPGVEERTAGFMRALGMLDVDEILSCFADSASLRLGNAPPSFGKPAIRRAVLQLATQLAGIEHRILSLWASGDSLSVIEVDAHLTSLSDAQFILPLTLLLCWTGGQIYSCQVCLYWEPCVAIEVTRHLQRLVPRARHT